MKTQRVALPFSPPSGKARLPSFAQPRIAKVFNCIFSCTASSAFPIVFSSFPILVRTFGFLYVIAFNFECCRQADKLPRHLHFPLTTDEKKPSAPPEKRGNIFAQLS